MGAPAAYSPGSVSLRAASCLHFAYCDFALIYQTLRVTQAVEGADIACQSR
jgi:hypothetical protein